ncbi:MAG: ABC transporter substrate-binding protein [Chloroflexi bacterium]|nr:ABC transporter substrate-binding protein [Chloroflexota bacterium]
MNVFKTRHRVLIYVVVALLIASVVGCGQAAVPSPTATQAPKASPAKEAKEAKSEPKPAAKEATKKEDKKLVKLTVPYTAVAGTSAALWVTKEKGLFEKYGLDIDLQLISTSTTLTQAMVSGEIGLAQMAGGAMANANLAGADLVIVAGVANVLVFSLYGQSSLKRIEELKGKSIGISRFGSSSDFAIRFALQKLGLEPGKDVSVVESGGSPESLAALQSGGIQAAVFGPPTTIKARKLGFGEVLSITDLGIPYAMGTMAVSRKFLTSNREAVMNFLKALSEGILVSKKEKDLALKAIGKYTKTDDKEELEETYDIYITKLLPKVPYGSPESMQTILDEIARSNPKAKDVKPDAYIDNSLVKELDDSGFIKKLWGE